MFTFRHHFHGLVAYCNIYQIKTFLSMCGSRKYPYHPHRRDLPYDPHSPLDFPKSVPNVYPPFPQEGNRYLVLFTRMPNFVSFMNFLLNSIADIKANSLCKFLMHSSHKQICEFHAFFDFLFHSQHQESNIINKRAGSCPTIRASIQLCWTKFAYLTWWLNCKSPISFIIKLSCNVWCAGKDLCNVFVIKEQSRAENPTKRTFLCVFCRVIQDFGLCKLDDLWRHIVETKWCKITKYGISVQMLSVQGWCAAKSTHVDNSYHVTKATYLLPDLYLPKIKSALFVAPESSGLSRACAA